LTYLISGMLFGVITGSFWRFVLDQPVILESIAANNNNSQC
jgi:hypothetical protein